MASEMEDVCENMERRGVEVCVDWWSRSCGTVCSSTSALDLLHKTLPYMQRFFFLSDSESVRMDGKKKAVTLLDVCSSGSPRRS